MPLCCSKERISTCFAFSLLSVPLCVSLTGEYFLFIQPRFPSLVSLSVSFPNLSISSSFSCVHSSPKFFLYPYHSPSDLHLSWSQSSSSPPPKKWHENVFAPKPEEQFLLPVFLNDMHLIRLTNDDVNDNDHFLEIPPMNTNKTRLHSSWYFRANIESDAFVPGAFDSPVFWVGSDFPPNFWSRVVATGPD